MSIKYLVLPALLLLSICAAAQTSADTANSKIFNYVERMPSSGYDLGEYLGSNIHYPDSARKYNIGGRIIVKFVVDRNGDIRNCEIVKGVDKYCDAEALRVVSSMPRWTPGYQDGKPVPVWFTLPILFKLQ